jgi:hypothetical protein
MTAPSNANTSGLVNVGHIVWWKAGGVSYYPEGEAFGVSKSCRVEPLVTAASAQARIDAAEARADRLSERLRADPTPEQLEPFARKWCIDNGIDPDAPKAPHGEWPEWYDACGPFAAMWRDLARAALQQETQP